MAAQLRVEVTPADYAPLCFIRAFDGDDLVYRRLVRKDDLAGHLDTLAARMKVDA
jgi:hypothetical protein